MESQKESLDHQLNIRLSERERQALEIISKATGQSKTALARSLITPTLIAFLSAIQSQNIELSS
ncbi:hypothetical protein [Nostoc sp.]|uniref:hypothetical protein n=1 Tax=Nostoc sp. TaxID=1180 RepID=UPI002FF7E069